MLASLLFGDYRQKVLARLLLHPEQRFHVREIARLTGTSAGTLHKELARLAQIELERGRRVEGDLPERDGQAFARQRVTVLRRALGGRKLPTPPDRRSAFDKLLARLYAP